MREIKFRGRDIESGKYVCGDLDTTRDLMAIWEIMSEDGYNVWRVRPESVRQLVARTKRGREIYEGDKVKLPNGQIITAELKSNLEAYQCAGETKLMF